MKPPKEPPQQYYATHRVRQHDPAVWERFNTAAEAWEPCTYDDVPDAVWSTGTTQDGWRFYTDRTQPFPGPRVISGPATRIEPVTRQSVVLESGLPDPITRLFTWDWKKQPPLTAILATVAEMSDAGPVWACEPDTGGDCYACIISDRSLTDEEIRKLMEER